MPKYFFAVGSDLYTWNPHDKSDKLNTSCEYFRKVFIEMEKHISETVCSLRVILTGNVDHLPEYGKDIIAVVNGDECGRPPFYAQDVGMTFKTYGTSPQWEPHGHSLDPVERGRVANSLRNTLRSIPYRWWSKSRSYARRLVGQSVSPTYQIPLGYNDSQIDLPLKPIEERGIDVFFAGTVNSRNTSPLSIRWWIPPPKGESRREMVKQVKMIKKNTPPVTSKIVVASDSDDDKMLSPEEYSRHLMNSKICLVPRGNNVETWRFFEALRYGCIVITEVLPDRWYYDDAPVYELESWDSLEEVISKMLGSQKIMKRKHGEMINWWQKKCSERAVGKFMAKRINTEMKAASA